MNIHDEALAIMDRDGWVQDEMHIAASDEGPVGHCTMGLYDQALFEAGINRFEDGAREGPVEKQLQEWTRRINAAIGELMTANPVISVNATTRFTINHKVPQGDAVTDWNDAEERTDAEVREALKLASELHEQTHGDAQ